MPVVPYKNYLCCLEIYARCYFFALVVNLLEGLWARSGVRCWTTELSWEAELWTSSGSADQGKCNNQELHFVLFKLFFRSFESTLRNFWVKLNVNERILKLLYSTFSSLLSIHTIFCLQPDFYTLQSYGLDDDALW